MSGLYNQSCRVLRSVETKDEWGEITSSWEEIYNEVPCHLSQKTLRPSDVSPVSSSRQDFKLFLSQDYAVLQGDKIEIAGRTFVTSEPMRYQRLKKQEILLSGVAE